MKQQALQRHYAKPIRNCQVAIIGGGPAGVAAAVQLQRYEVDVVLLEPAEIGGLLRSANLVENHPGFPQGICGQRLADALAQSLNQIGVDIRRQSVTALSERDGGFELRHGENITFAPFVLIASGTKPRRFEAHGFEDALGFSAFQEIVPLLKVEGARIAIIGGGDAAFDYALNLSAKKNLVVIFNRSAKLRCLPLLRRRVEADPRIELRKEWLLESVKQEEAGVTLEWSFEDKRASERFDYLLTATGRVPNTDFIDGSLLNKRKELEIMGIMSFIGDVANGLFRQSIIAAGDGVRAAMMISNKLQGRR